MKRIFLAAFFIFHSVNPHIIFGQSQIDSLKKIIETSQEPQEQIDALLDLAELFKTTNNTENKFYLDQIAELLNEYPDSIKTAQLYKYYANYYQFKSEYEKAAEYFLEAVRIAENWGDYELRNSALNGLAILHLRTGNMEKGIEVFQELLDYSIKTGNEEDVIHYSLNVAMASAEAGNFDIAVKLLKEVYNSEPKNKFYKAVAANSLSFICNYKSDFKKAFEYGKYAAEFAKDFPDVAFKIESLTNYSNALKGLGENEKAGKIMFEVVDLARENNFIRKMNNAIGNIALNYEAMGDYKSAYKYYKKYSRIKDSLLTESTTAKINELQIKYETEKKDKEIVEKTASLKEKNIELIYAATGTVVFVLISVVVFILYGKKNAAYKELVKKNIELLKQEDEAVKSRDVSSEKYGSSSLRDSKKSELVEKIQTIVIDEKMYLQSDLTLGKLSHKLGCNSKYVSQAIHEVYNLNFSDFINRLRVKEAARMLNDESYRHFSFEGISQLVGFKAKSTFNACFKKFTGVTPSFYSSASAEISI